MRSQFNNLAQQGEFVSVVLLEKLLHIELIWAIKQLNIKTKNWRELLTDETIIREDLTTIQLILMHLMAGWVLVDFDHVKNSLKLDDEDPTYNINVSGDIKQMLKELGTEKGKEIALHRGGGNKAQKSTNEEEDEQVTAKDEKNDKIGSWYNNAGKGASESGSVGGGVGKYLKVRNAQAESAVANWYAGNCYSKEKEIRCSNGGI
ncbi:unnamed protein product [Camellia sinensis]